MSPASHSKGNNVVEIDISVYLNSDSAGYSVQLHKNDQIVLINYSLLFIMVSDS